MAIDYKVVNQVAEGKTKELGQVVKILKSSSMYILYS
jgi:hypothetical protein